MDVLQFTFKNDTTRFSANNNYYCHDMCHSFEPIFKIFTWLVRVYKWVNPIVFRNHRPVEPSIWGKCAHQNWFFSFYSASMGFFEEKISKPFSVPRFL